MGITYRAIVVPEPTSSPSTKPSLSPTINSSPVPTISIQPSIKQSIPPSMSQLPTSLPTTTPSLSFIPSLGTISSAPSASLVPTEKNSEIPTENSSPAQWFMDWDVIRCRQLCSKNRPCEWKADYWMTLYDTAHMCCADSLDRSPNLAKL